MLFRGFMIGAATISAAVGVARKLLSREIDRRRDTRIRELAEEVRAQIRAGGQHYLDEVLRRFAVVTMIKVSLLAGVALFFFLGLGPPTWLGPSVIALLAIFFIRDTIALLPTFRLGFVEVRKHGFRAKRILGEMVAERVFAQVVREADEQEMDWKARLMLAVSGRDRLTLNREIAAALADIARRSSWSDLKPFLLSALFRFAVVWAIYAGALTLIWWVEVPALLG